MIRSTDGSGQPEPDEPGDAEGPASGDESPSSGSGELAAPEVELRAPGLRLLHPSDAEVKTDVVETRSHVIRKIHIRGPWLTSASQPGVGTRCEVRILIFEDPGGGTVDDPVETGRIAPDPGRYRLVPGTLGGLEATFRKPHDTGQMRRAAYASGERRFFFVEWRGPAEAILESLELTG